MASITGLSNQNYVSSLYNSSKTISGLATGMDTEGMIEGLTKSYQTKITQLQQRSTKIEWKQEAYRSMISKMYSYSNKYTSYTSSTNLLSQSFWNSARTSGVYGTNSSKVSASGTTTSDIKLNSVSQMATAARYATTGSFGNVDGKTVTGKEINLEDPMELSNLQGTLSFTYGNKLVSVSFSESDAELLKPQTKENGNLESNAEVMARAINEKLKNETITLSDGSSVAANERISVTADANGNISLADKSSAGNSVYLSDASGTVGNVLGLGDLSDTEANKSKTSFKVGNNVKLVDDQVNRLEKMSGKSMNVNLNGTIKKIELPTVKKNSDGTYNIGDKENVSAADAADEYAKALNKTLQDEFGDKIEVKNIGKVNEDGIKGLKLEFSLKDEGDELLINSDAGDALGIGKVASNYLSTGKTLKELGFTFDPNDEIKDENDKGTGKYKFSINGKDIGEYDENTTLATIMSDINSKSDVKVSYSKTSREFVFTSKDTGKNAKVEFGGAAQKMFGATGDAASDNFSTAYGLSMNDGETKSVTFEMSGFDYSFDVSNASSMEDIVKELNYVLPNEGYTASYNKTSGQIIVTDSSGKMAEFKLSSDNKTLESKSTSSYTAGQDAKFQVEVNGRVMDMTRSSNKVDIDGLSINFKGTFDKKEGDDPVTFQTEIKSDKVVDEVKNMIAELNVLLAEARGAYATMPNQKSSGDLYDPLTDDDMSGMSETAIKNYEEKAKQGLLFADSNISGLYNNLVNVFNRAGMDRTMMDKMGIGLSYDSNGAATITLDESKFKQALENDFDGVVDMFTRTKENGAASDGIMQGIKTQMDRYGATTGSVKGILVQQAGTPLASLSLLDNGWQKEIDNISEQITKWQEKLEKQVDRYTKMFTRLETLTNQMNSQSSALAGLMGG